MSMLFFFQAEDGIRDVAVTGVQTCALPISPVWREYERASTAIIDAYIKPLVREFVEEISEGLRRRGLSIPFSVMKANGGQMLAEAARGEPAQTVPSGPARGVIAGEFF